jgi:hypothetical protein
LTVALDMRQPGAGVRRSEPPSLVEGRAT